MRKLQRVGILGLLVGLAAFGCDDSDAVGLSGGVSIGDAGLGGGAGGGGGQADPGGGWSGADASSPGWGNAADAGAGWGGAGGAGGQGGAGGGGAAPPPAGNTNIGFGGTQDLGYFRRLLGENRVPTSEDFDAEGFFAEHHTVLPTPDCGERVCVQAMLGVLGNLINGANCTLLQIGLNSPLVAHPGNRPPLNLVVVVDVSGSMRAAGKLDFVQSGLRQMVNELRDGDQIALVTYSSQATLLHPMSPVEGERNALGRLIDSMLAAGGTNLSEGLQLGFREAIAHYDSGRQNRVIMLSDGQPTDGITDSRRLLEMSRAYNSEGVGLTTVGLGSDFNFPLMRGLAEQGDGNFYFVEDAAAVEEVFTEELAYFTVPVAFDVQLTMQAGSDYEYFRAYGSRMWETNAERTGGAVEVPSVFLAHRVSHDDVGPGNTRRGGGSALLVELMPIEDPDRAPGEARVATVDLQYREPGTDRIVNQSVRVTYPDLPWVLRPQGHFDNRIVEKSFVMLNIYVGLVMAVDSFHLERDPEGAIAILERLMAAVEDYEDGANDGEGDVDMRLDIELMQQLVDVILANGGRRPAENDIPEDPWPAD